MEEKPDSQKIDQFKLDLAVLRCYYTYEEIGEAMGYRKSNFSNYRRGKNTITKKFLEKFDNAWGERLKAIYSKRLSDYSNTPLPEISATGEVLTYAVKNYQEDPINAFQKSYDTMQDHLGKVIDNNTKLVGNNEKVIENNGKLVGNNEILVESNRKLVEANLTLLGRQAGGSDNH